jgi:hypothetical protein
LYINKRQKLNTMKTFHKITVSINLSENFNLKMVHLFKSKYDVDVCINSLVELYKTHPLVKSSQASINTKVKTKSYSRIPKSYILAD